ncbi:hypothetical protein EDB84DRAFT_1516876, partial [Lactarius hengduanensis]
MHVLRSTYLPSYVSLIRPPYTSDPFPLSATPSAAGTSAGLHRSRETAVLDLFIALKVLDDVWADETELHLGQPEAFRDLFDLMQPRARLEDLLHAYLASHPHRPLPVERAKDESLEVAAKRLGRRLKDHLAERSDNDT